MRFKHVEVVGHAQEVTISSDEIGTALGIGRSTAHRALTTALDRGFLINNEIRRGKPFRLVLKHSVVEATFSVLHDPTSVNSSVIGLVMTVFCEWASMPSPRGCHCR